jgi:dolichol-phosphate mannosyltransferase
MSEPSDRARPVIRPLVIVPTYQEAENIADVLGRIRSALPGASVLVVDDGSPDGTADLAEITGKEVGQVEVLRRASKQGLGSAYRAGFRWGIDNGFDAMVEMDADLQHDPAALPTLVAPLDREADLVVGSRYIPGGSTPNWKKHRLWLSQWGNRYAGSILGLGVRDATSGFRAYRADLLSRINLDAVHADGYGFQIEMCHQTRKAGGEIVEVPIRFGERTRGTSKMSVRIIVEALILVTWWGLRDRLLRRSTKQAQR